MSIFLSYCILHFGFQLSIFLLYYVLDFGFQLSIFLPTAFRIMDSNCQFWVPIVNFLTVLGFLHFGFQLSILLPFCVLHFGFQLSIFFYLLLCFAFWIPIYHHWNFTQEQLQAAYEYSVLQCHTHHHPRPLPPRLICSPRLTQPCPHCMWALPPLMSAKVDQPVGSISPLNRKCMPSNYQRKDNPLAGENENGAVLTSLVYPSLLY